MGYTVGANMAGYLPEGDVHYCRTFDEAKAMLIHDLAFYEDYAEDEDEAEDYSAAQQDVNLWNVPDNVYIGNMVYWIMETEDDEDDEELDEGYPSS